MESTFPKSAATPSEVPGPSCKDVRIPAAASLKGAVLHAKHPPAPSGAFHLVYWKVPSVLKEMESLEMV